MSSTPFFMMALWINVASGASATVVAVANATVVVGAVVVGATVVVVARAAAVVVGSGRVVLGATVVAGVVTTVDGLVTEAVDFDVAQPLRASAVKTMAAASVRRAGTS
jgi:hypothetical protein